MNRLRAYLELIRLPNVFTALADVLAGYWLASRAVEWSAALGLMLFAAACLYSTGIVLNDIRDLEADRVERPARPLPSGRVRLAGAQKLALLLIAAALVATLTASLLLGHHRPLLVAGLLLVAIVLYDLFTKESALGPVNMGLCRGLNLMLGMSPVMTPTAGPQLLAVLCMVLFVASITFFGRQETGTSARPRLVLGAWGIAVAIALLGLIGAPRMTGDLFAAVLWGAVAIHLARVTLRAIRSPGPAAVQYAMKTYILAIIAIDAALAAGAHGWSAAAAILSLLIPAVLVGRWIDST